MAASQTSPVIRYIHRIAATHSDQLPDSILLDRFCDGHNEDAFAILVRRHGRLVLGVCRRILHDWHTSEDCFQAVFLVLASKAGSLKRTQSLGPWLHAVATRVALKARSQRARRTLIEHDAASCEAQFEDHNHDWHELRPILDEAINRLADKYRIPFVLCHLQGRTVSEIASQFGEPRGTVAARLARARVQLRKALTQRGIALSATGLGLILGGESLAASVPPALTAETLRVAGLFAVGRAEAAGLVSKQTAALMEGAMRSMFMTKMKSVVVMLALVAVASAVFGYNVLAADDAVDKGKAVAGRIDAPKKAKLVPAAVVPWHEARVQVFEIDEDGEETVISHPCFRTLDNQTGSLTVGQEILVGDQRIIQGLTCSLTLRSVADGKISVDASATKNDKVVPLKHGHKIVSRLTQLLTTINEGEKIELMLEPTADGDPAIRISMDTRFYKDKSMEIVPWPEWEKPAKWKVN